MSTGLQKQLKGALIGGLFASLFCAQGVVSAATESEPNDSQAQAQALAITDTGASVSGMVGTAAGAATTDLDLYFFDGMEGDVPSIMVTTDANWDPFLVLFDSAGNILDMNDDAYPMNPDSISGLDSRLDTYRLPANGRYYVGVTPVPRYPGAGFSIVFPDPATGGGYTLAVTGVTPPPPAPAPEPDPEPAPETPPTSGSGAMIVTMQVRHWTAADNEPENRNRKDLIPVAIMSSADFNAMDVDPNSLTFGAVGNERSLFRCKKKGKDVKVDKVKDGRKDLVCYFRADLAGFKVGDVQAFLKGKTVAGDEFEASAALKVYRVSGKKTESYHKRHNLNPRGR